MLREREVRRDIRRPRSLARQSHKLDLPGRHVFPCAVRVRRVMGQGAVVVGVRLTTASDNSDRRGDRLKGEFRGTLSWSCSGFAASNRGIWRASGTRLRRE